MSTENSFDFANQSSTANAENVSPTAVGIEAPEYGNESSVSDQIGLSANGEDGNNNIDINDPEQAAKEYERLKESNASTRKPGQIGEYLKYHPSLFVKEIAGYRYVADVDTKKPYFISSIHTSKGGQIPYYGFDEAFTKRVVDFNNKKALERETDKEKYIIWEDVKVTGGCKFIEGTLWGEKKDPLTVSAFGLSKDLGSDQFEITFPGPSIGSLSADLTKPFFGLKANFRPSFSLGLFGVSLNPEKAEFTLSAGLRKADIGVDISITGKINTDKTEEESKQYICYELLPWVGELIDALG